MELTAIQFDLLFDAIEQNNITVEEAVSRICGKVAAPIISADKKGHFRLVVDYSLTIEEMIKKCISCDVSFQPTQAILLKKNMVEVLRARLFVFNTETSSTDAIVFMKNCNCRPGNFAELLALIAILNNDIDVSIIALMTRWGSSDNSQVSVFSQRRCERTLLLHNDKDGWSKECVFLGIMDTQVPK